MASMGKWWRWQVVAGMFPLPPCFPQSLRIAILDCVIGNALLASKYRVRSQMVSGESRVSKVVVVVDESTSPPLPITQPRQASLTINQPRLDDADFVNIAQRSFELRLFYFIFNKGDLASQNVQCLLAGLNKVKA